MNITLDDTSPLFQYVSVNASDPWLQDSATNSEDEKIVKYYRSTMTKTTGEGNYMSYTFSGTAIYIYGSKRENHGAYSVSVDGADPVVQLGHAPAPGAYQQLLFSAGSLDTGTEHEVRVTNLPSQNSDTNDTKIAWLDIDYVILTVALPELDATAYTTRIDDTSLACRYDGEGWTTDTPMHAPEYYNSTAHITHHVNDSVICDFNGTSVEVLGGLMSDHGNYSVSIDDGPERVLNGSYHTIMPQTTLFTAGQLSEGPHTVRLTNLVPDIFLDFDCLVVNSTIAPPPTGNDTVTPVVIPDTSDDGNQGNTDSKDGGTAPLTMQGSIGITVGIVLGTALILVLAHLGWRWRRKVRSRNRLEGINKIRQIDLTGEEIRPFTNVSPITMYNDAKYLYSPANPTPLWTGAAFPTPLRSTAAFFPYAPPSTAGTGGSSFFFSPPTSSSFAQHRARALDRLNGSEGTSESASTPSGGIRTSSETGTFGDIPILPCPPPPAAGHRSGHQRGSISNRSGSQSGGSESTFALLERYNTARSILGEASPGQSSGDSQNTRQRDFGGSNRL